MSPINRSAREHKKMLSVILHPPRPAGYPPPRELPLRILGIEEVGRDFFAVVRVNQVTLAKRLPS